MEHESRSNSINFEDHEPKLTNIELNDLKFSEPRSLNIILKTIKKAKDESENPVKFFQNLYQLAFNSIGFTISFIILTCIPIAMIAIGFYQRDECPTEYRIPLWLIVMGIIGLITGISRVLTSLFIFFKKRNNIVVKEPCIYSCLFFVLCFFMSVWFVIGNVWVFSKYTTVQHTNENLANYCHIICYNFAFWSLIFFWILVGLLFIFSLSIIIYFVFGLVISRCCQ